MTVTTRPGAIEESMTLGTRPSYRLGSASTIRPSPQSERSWSQLGKFPSWIKRAEGIKDAYPDLFRVNRNANSLPREQLSGKIKSLTEGKLFTSDSGQHNKDVYLTREVGRLLRACRRRDSGAGPSNL